jgi:exodeoxyribonuclease VII small subunit
MNPTPDQPTFEEALKRLEDIVHLLEEGNLGLNESLERYEEGVRLLRLSYEILHKAERRIEILSDVDADGNPITRPLDAVATIDQAPAGTRRSRRRSAPTMPPESADCTPPGGAAVDEP